MQSFFTNFAMFPLTLALSWMALPTLAQGPSTGGPQATGRIGPEASRSISLQAAGGARKDAALLHGLDSLYEATVQDPDMHFNGIFTVVDHGKVIYQKATGMADIANKTPIDEHTRFSLASTSKLFTSIAVLELVQQGKISLDDTLKHYFPDFPYPAITVRQLLTHTSGLPDFQVFQGYVHPGMSLTIKDLIPALIASGQLISEPGTAWNYSSVGMGLLALLVEKVSGMPYRDYIKMYICKPAHMNDSFVDDPNGTGEGPSKEVAIQYRRPQTGAISVDDEDPFHSDNPFQTIVGPGLMVSTADDMVRFDQALYSGVLLNPELTKEMFTPVLYGNGQPVRLEHAPLFQGLGWGIDIDSTGGEVVSHNGGAPGISTIILRNIDTQTAVILLENTGNRAIFTLGINAMNLMNHKPFLGPGPGPTPGPRPGGAPVGGHR